MLLRKYGQVFLRVVWYSTTNELHLQVAVCRNFKVDGTCTAWRGIRLTLDGYSIKAVHTINSSSHLPQICRTTDTEYVSCKLSNIQEI